MIDILNEKKRLRSDILRHRSEIPLEKIIQDSVTIIDKLINLEAYNNSGTIMCFIDFKKEVITIEFIRYSLDAGKRVLLPIILKQPDGNRTMKASQLIDPEQDLASGTMGILEPKPEKCRFVEPSEIDFFVVPGLAFDVTKNRLGYGAGYHDGMQKKLRETLLV